MPRRPKQSARGLLPLNSRRRLAAEVAADARNFTEFIDDYSRTIELDPKYAKAYRNRGKTYRLLGKHKKAMADYNKYERLAREQNLSDLLAEVCDLKRQLK